MTEWIEVITHPLGLCGFALSVVFGLLGIKAYHRNRWLLPVAIGMACVTLVGGLVLAYRQSSPLTISEPHQNSTQPSIDQKTGDGSPAVAGVDGDVEINIEQRSGSEAEDK